MTIQEENFKDDDQGIDTILVENVESGIVIVIKELIACSASQHGPK